MRQRLDLSYLRSRKYSGVGSSLLPSGKAPEGSHDQGRGDYIGVDRERDDHVAEIGRRGGRSKSSPPSQGGGLKLTSCVSDVVLRISAPEASTEPAPKRARNFGTTSTPRGTGKGFFTCGLNQSEGCATLATLLDAREEKARESTSYFENAEKKAREKVAKLSDEVVKLNDEITKLKGELKNSAEEQQKINENYKTIRDKYVREQTGGKKFLSSEGGKRLLESIAKKVVDAYQTSLAFYEVIVQHAMVLYDDIVHDCRQMLRETGRVPENIVMILDPRVPELGDTIGDIISLGNEVIEALDVSDVIVELVEADDPPATSVP
ncbi:hypothetical protein Pfo_021824 [Paulownia fortunei]|nr:hypothetical protein Pfo_021824 [Paulownia fortunei]